MARYSDLPPLTVLRWDDPPPTPFENAGQRQTHRESKRYGKLARELVWEPGKWAVVFSGTRAQCGSVASTINHAQVKCFSPSGSYQAVVRTTSPGVTDVYARFKDPFKDES